MELKDKERKENIGLVSKSGTIEPDVLAKACYNAPKSIGI